MERELVPVKVKPVKKEKKEEIPIEELPDEKAREIPNRWRVK